MKSNSALAGIYSRTSSVLNTGLLSSTNNELEKMSFGQAN